MRHITQPITIVLALMVLPAVAAVNIFEMNYSAAAAPNAGWSGGARADNPDHTLTYTLGIGPSGQNGYRLMMDHVGPNAGDYYWGHTGLFTGAPFAYADRAYFRWRQRWVPGTNCQAYEQGGTGLLSGIWRNKIMIVNDYSSSATSRFILGLNCENRQPPEYVFTLQKGGGVDPVNTPYYLATTDWVDVQVELQYSSAQGVADGAYRIWVNNNNQGTPTAERTNIFFTPETNPGGQPGYVQFGAYFNNGLYPTGVIGFEHVDFQIGDEFNNTWDQPLGGPAPDTTPPTATITAPTTGQIIAAGQTTTPLTITTNEAATCKWSASDQSYSSMPAANTLTGSTSHTGTITGLASGPHTTYVRCQDTAGNAMTSSEQRTFSVAAGSTPTQLTGAGPNVPPGATLLFRLDVTQPNQNTLNPTGSFLYGNTWSNPPQQSPTFGTFWNQDAGDGHTFVRFAWRTGSIENQPGNAEYNVPSGTYNNLYVRTVWRANSGWQTNGGGGKHIYLQNGAGSGTINVAPAFGTDGTYGLSAVIMNLYTNWLHATGNPHNPTGDWYDDEWRFTNLETNLADGTVAVWVDGVSQPLSGSGSGVRFSQSGNGINIIKLGPWHGGSGAKTQDGDYIDYKLIEVWRFDTAPSAVCGNGAVESGESCDNGASNGACPATCSSSCATNACSSGPTITVDSTYSGYTTAPIDDDVINPTGGTATTWASNDNAAQPHWIQLAFSQPTTLNTFTMHWAYNNVRSAYMTSQELHVQYWDGSTWQTATTFNRAIDEPSTTITFPSTIATQYRLYQNANMGNPAYPVTLWVTEINYGSAAQIIGDVDGNGVVNVFDITMALQDKASTYNARSDLNSDGTINVFDLVLIARNWS